jgi:hypothetical protein
MHSVRNKKEREKTMSLNKNTQYKRRKRKMSDKIQIDKMAGGQIDKLDK